jgi:xanthosine utilization system XapX-like protein
MDWCMVVLVLVLVLVGVVCLLLPGRTPIPPAHLLVGLNQPQLFLQRHLPRVHRPQVALHLQQHTPVGQHGSIQPLQARSSL